MDESSGRRARKLGRCLIAITLASGMVPIACAGQAPSDFNQTFSARNAPPSVHFLAQYTAAGKVHRLEVWRDHDLRLKRRTDDAIETHVRKPANGPEWAMVVLDLRQKIRTDIDRTSLYRVGHFIDWFGMAHGLTRPLGPYVLLAGAAVPGVQPPVAPCRWYRLSNQGRDSRICWSQTMALPMIIATADGHVQWRVLEVDQRPAVPATFQIHDQGFVRNDANADISTD